MIGFVLLQLLLLALFAIAAYGAGGLVGRFLPPISWEGEFAVRTTAGLAILGTALGFLGLCGSLGRMPIAGLYIASMAAAWLLRRPAESPLPPRPRASRLLALALPFVPLFALTLYPPIAFDETLYHLPTVEGFARAGALPFLSSLRAPVFPHLAEVLEIPLFLFGSDVATHLVALLATLLTTVFIFACLKETESELAGLFGAALFLSAPIVVHLSNTGYVEPLTTLFVTASFYAFGRWFRGQETAWLLAAALFCGAGTSVKYLCLFFLGVIGLGVWLGSARGHRLRNVLLFAGGAALVAAPWYGRIFFLTGNPLFPYLPGLFGHSVWDPLLLPGKSLPARLVTWARIPWDTLFDRVRTGRQPPFSLPLALLLPLVFVHAVRHRLTRILLSVVLVWAFVWTSLPPDGRYLTLILPLASLVASLALLDFATRAGLSRRLLGLLAIVTLLPGMAYAAFRLRKAGAIPVDAPAREEWLRRSIPEYAAVAFVNERLLTGELVYMIGAPELTYHGHGRMIGELSGPMRYDQVLDGAGAAELERRLGLLAARYVVVARKGVPARLMSEMESLLSSEAARPFFRSVYADEAAIVYERLPAPSPDRG